MARGRSGEEGFTLIEVLVVLLVLALMAGLVVARGPARSAGLELRLAANAVAGALRLARTGAIARNGEVAVTFDTSAATLRVGAGPPRALPRGVAVSVTGTADAVAGGRGAIRFMGDGSSSGGRVELTGGGQAMQVGVDWLTGRVAVAGSP